MRDIVLNQSIDFYDEDAIQKFKEKLHSSPLLTTLHNETKMKQLEEVLLVKFKNEMAKRNKNKRDAELEIESRLDNITIRKVALEGSTVQRSAIDEFPPDFMSDKVSECTRLFLCGTSVFCLLC